MEERALRGIPWTLLTYGSSKLITVATTIVLARLLTPDEFGVVALALLATGLFALLRDFGLSGVLVLRQDLDRRAQGTVLTMMLVLGVVITALTVALAPLIADLFSEPELDEVVAALSVTILIGSMTWFYEAVLQRELQFKRRFYSLFAQTATYACVAIALAVAGAGVWSLVGGQIAGTVVLAVTLYALTPYRVRPAYDRGRAVDVLKSARGFFAQGGLAFVQQNADYFVVGRTLGAAQVGFYSMAYRMAELPYLAIADPVAKVTFPSFARMRHRGEQVERPFLTTLHMVALVTCPLAISLSACAEPFTRALFGENWLEMIGPLAVLGVWAALRPIQVTIAWLLNSIGEAGLMGTISLVVLAPLIPGLFVAAELGGITAVAWLMLADMLLSLVLLSFFAARRAGVSLGAQWGALRAVVLACPIAWLTGRGVAVALDGQAALPALACSAMAVLAVYAIGVSVIEPGALHRAIGRAAATLGRVPQ